MAKSYKYVTYDAGVILHSTNTIVERLQDWLLPAPGLCSVHSLLKFVQGIVGILFRKFWAAQTGLECRGPMKIYCC